MLVACGRSRYLPCAVLLLIPAIAAPWTAAQDAKTTPLLIGSSGNLASPTPGTKETSALETLRRFIKDETGLDNEIVRQKDWRVLAARMAKGELKIGVFQGYEFAWAQEEYPKLEPLALAVNGYRYPVVYVVTRRDDTAKDFAGLAGQSLGLAGNGQPLLRFYVRRQSEAEGKKLDAFFSKVTAPENIEDALDDVVDGVVQATAVDRTALEAYKRRKPGRFSKLKDVAHSQPFPPAVVAYYDSSLDEVTRQRFRQGLIGANRKERGEMMLTLFRLTGFEAVPEDFNKILANVRKTYPVPTK
jgi:ABC-type phosphate/phosphonate transport system substrate-binding protein